MDSQWAKFRTENIIKGKAYIRVVLSVHGVFNFLSGHGRRADLLDLGGITRSSLWSEKVLVKLEELFRGALETYLKAMLCALGPLVASNKWVDPGYLLDQM